MEDATPFLPDLSTLGPSRSQYRKTPAISPRTAIFATVGSEFFSGLLDIININATFQALRLARNPHHLSQLGLDH